MVQRFGLVINSAVAYLSYFLYIQGTLYQSYHTDQAQIFYIDYQMLVSRNLQQNNLHLNLTHWLDFKQAWDKSVWLKIIFLFLNQNTCCGYSNVGFSKPTKKTNLRINLTHWLDFKQAPR